MGGSPFLTQHAILGNKLEEFMGRLSLFRGMYKDNWVNMRMAMTYYLDGNWALLEKEISNMLGDNIKKPLNEFGCHDMMHRTFDLIFAPLWIEPYYPNMKVEFHNMIGLTLKAKPELSMFVKNLIQNGTIQEHQRNLFHCMSLFMENKSALLPGLAAEMYPKGVPKAFVDLRLFRDEFPKLRDMYISTFETCHHILTIVMGLVNIAYQNDLSRFNLKEPINLDKFDKLVNSKKTNYLVVLPTWQKLWPIIFDRQIRNAIGHHDIRHDLKSDMLLLKSIPAIPYLKFVTMSLRIIHPILAAADVLKMVRMIGCSNE